MTTRDEFIRLILSPQRQFRNALIDLAGVFIITERFRSR